MGKWLSDNVGYLPGAVNIGFIRTESGTYLVDTGIDNSSVNKAVKVVGQVKGALVTHHHADHMGGLNKLEKMGVTELFAPSGELDMIRNPTNEPYTMFGGGIPPKIMRNRHLEARPCTSIRANSEQDIAAVVKTPGHTTDHSAYLFDNHFFTGDAAFTPETIEKYRLLFAVDPMRAAESASAMKSQSFDVMVPGHGPLLDQRSDALEVIASTERHYSETAERVLTIIGEKIPLMEYTDKVMAELGLMQIVKDRGFIQYILYQVPIMGYLSNALDLGKIEIEISNNGPIIQAV